MEREKLIEEMTKIFGKENLLSSQTDLLLYGYDASLFRGKPDCIVLPGSTEEVSKVVKFAHEAGIHVLGRGSGTNLSGGTIPTQGGIIIHFSRMNKILEIDIENQRAVVEPGIFTLTFKNALARYGYLYQPDPASEKVSTFGGNIDLKGATSGFVYINQDNIGTAAFHKLPRYATQDQTGTASLYAAGGEPVEGYMWTGGEMLTFAVADGGGSKAGTFYFWFG